MAATGILAWLGTHPAADDEPFPIPGEAIALEVEVLNGTSFDGLARSVTQRLRRAGIDVVFFGTGTRTDSTMLFVRRGDSAVASAVRDVLGFGRVVVEPDLGLLLDVTVLLGPDAMLFLTDP